MAINVVGTVIMCKNNQLRSLSCTILKSVTDWGYNWEKQTLTLLEQYLYNLGITKHLLSKIPNYKSHTKKTGNSVYQH